MVKIQDFHHQRQELIQGLNKLIFIVGMGVSQKLHLEQVK
jgi:hypothetical protein